MAVSDEWKTMGDFAPGLEGNRLPSTDALAGRTFTLLGQDGFGVVNRYQAGSLEYEVTSGPRAGSSGSESYDAVEVRDGIFFVSFAHLDRQEGVVQVLDTRTGRFLVSIIGVTDADNNIDPRVEPHVTVGRILECGDGAAPDFEESRDLIGKRVMSRYSPTQAYEHIYITSHRYAWHALEGPQRGHSDVELSLTYRIDDGLYFFTWYEKIIPTCASFLFDTQSNRSTGFFFGLSGEGQVLASVAGAEYHELSSTTYPDGVSPA